MALTDEQRMEVRVLVGPNAWQAHNSLPSEQQVNVDDAFTVLQDTRLVAAEVLDTVALAASEGDDASKIEVGPIKLTLLPGEGISAWLARAARYRAEASGSGVPGPALTPWGQW